MGKGGLVPGLRRTLVLAAIACAFALPASAQAAFCADDPTAPCVQSASVNGTPVTSSHPDWDLSVLPYSVDGSDYVSVTVRDKVLGTASLGADSLDDVWIVSLDVGTLRPRVVSGKSDDTSITRIADGDGTFHVEITGTPVVVTQGCSQVTYPPVCPETAPEEFVGYFDGRITNYNSWIDPVQRAAFYGMNYTTNVDATSIPPQVITTPAGDGLLVDLANSHFRADGATVVTGQAHLRIPNAFLRAAYGIDDPATLTGSGIATSTSGSPAGAGTTTVTLVPGAVQVDITGVTFSARRIRIIRGNIRPTRPGRVRARRTGRAGGRLTFLAARRRGSRLKRYQALCRARGHHRRALVGPRVRRMVVQRLRPRVAYRCRVRALAKAGPGRWSRAVRLAANPR